MNSRGNFQCKMKSVQIVNRTRAKGHKSKENETRSKEPKQSNRSKELQKQSLNLKTY